MRRRTLLLFVLLATVAAAQTPPNPDWQPQVEPASDEGQQAIARFRLPKGFSARLWAAEPRCANIVSFCIDDRGDVLVAETFRMHEGTLDLRDHMDWLEDDLRCRSVADRVAMIQKWEKDRFADFRRASERIKWLRDTDGDGVADVDLVFAQDFRDPATGLAAGLLAHQGSVYFTCMPDLWRFIDQDRDGVPETRQVLSHGYGVHTAMIGHDLHGLRIGMDGRLYFSCGDRAFRVQTERGVLDHTHTGGVLRCNLDGTGLEVFASGLRNPQELAFDELGNLFTGDNNSDGGDRARFVHVIEGSDSGYRYGYQWQEDPHQRGPWNEEKLWHPHFPGQAAYLLPPIAWLGAGPSGLTYYPGSGLTEEDRGRFFLANFTGSQSSAVLVVTVKPKGATFELGPVDTFLSGSLVTDCEIGPDGALWWSDWVQGWRKTGKGRIYRATHPSTETNPDVVRTQVALRQGMAQRPVEVLSRLLLEPDQRVRLAAQLELAARGEPGVHALRGVALQSDHQLARLHGIWGLGVAARAGAVVEPALFVALLSEADAETRAQAAWCCGDLRIAAAQGPLVGLLRDPSARVRLYASVALGKLGGDSALEPLLALAREVGESDPALRHGVVLGLAGCAQSHRLAQVAGDRNADARIAAIVALRRQKSAQVAAFLADADPRVATEAARAGYDLVLAETLPGLAARTNDPKAEPAPLMRRALAACLRLGDEDAARRLVRFALRADAADALRVEALEHLRRWCDPPGRDPISGEWQPFPRSAAQLNAARDYLPKLTAELGAGGAGQAGDGIARAWLSVVQAFPAADAASPVRALVLATQRGSKLRVEAFRALAALAPVDLLDTARTLLAGTDVELRVAAMETLRDRAPAETLSLVHGALAAGSVADLRFAYASLARVDGHDAETVLEQELRRHNAGLVSPEVALDLVLAAQARLGERTAPIRTQRAAARDLDPLLAPWLDCLHGGDRERGRKVFREHKQLGCQRCHRTDDDDASGQVGPNLRGLGQRATRLRILESLADPNRHMTPGFQGMTLELKDGTLVSGLIERETQDRVQVRKADDTVVRVPPGDIKARRVDLSSMPEGLIAELPPAELRDLIEYLASLK